MISCVSFCSLQVNNDLMLSPGRVTIKDTKSIDRKRNIEQQRKSSISYKRRRIELKKNMLDTTAANETREGKPQMTSFKFLAHILFLLKRVLHQTTLDIILCILT